MQKDLSLNPNDGEFYFNKALILDQMGNIGEAKKAVEKSIILAYPSHLPKVREIIEK